MVPAAHRRSHCRHASIDEVRWNGDPSHEGTIRPTLGLKCPHASESFGTVVSTTIHGFGAAGQPQTRTTNTALYSATGEPAAFDPGGSFQSSWLALPQPPLLLRSTDGPRTDLADVTSLVYYPIDASVPALLRGRLAASRNAAGHVTRFEGYDVFGNVTRAVDANGVATQTTYDALGRASTSTTKGVASCDTGADPLCATDLTTSRTYSPSAGPLQSETRPGGGITVYTYDSRGRVRTVSRGPSANDLREQIETTWDPLTGKKGLERTLAFEGGAWVEKRREGYGYTILGELETVLHADGTSVVYSYDAEGRVGAVRDENHSGPNTSYHYDPAGRLDRVTQTLATAAGGVITTRYGYDLHGNLVSVTDPNGNVTSYAYDDFGQLVSQGSPVTGTTTYRYDEGSNLTMTTDANGAATVRSYDALGRVLTSESTLGAEAERVEWTYDDPSVPFGVGRLARMTDPTGSTSYRYERRGLLGEETKVASGTTFVTRYQYDGDGNRSSMRYPSGRIVTFGFDFADRPVSAATGGTTLVSSATYLPFGPASGIVYGNGTALSATFDARYRPLTRTLLRGAEAVASYRYEHDDAGNITRIDDLVDAGFSRELGYDDLNRLTTANSGAALWGSGGYAYDAMGNLTSLQLGAGRTASLSYEGTTPKIASVVENGVTSAVDYDAAGNERLAGASAYAYSPRNTLASADEATYGYDGRGIRTTTRRPVSLSLVALATASTSGGTPVVGRVRLSGAIPVDASVLLTSSSASATVPANVTIGAGAIEATFEITTVAVSAPTSVTITTSWNGTTRSATLTILPPALRALTVTPSALTGSQAAEGRVEIDGLAPAGGLTIDLLSSAPAVSVPAQITIAEGASAATFAIATSAVSVQQNITITAALGSSSRTATLTLLPHAIAQLSLSPLAVYGGTSAEGTVSVTAPAPAEGLTVTLGATGPVTVPAGVSIAPGAQAAAFPIATEPVDERTTVPVTASLNGSQATGSLRIDPADLDSLAVAPATVVGGETAAATATLNAPAGPAGAVIPLSTSEASVVPSPEPIAVAPGASSGETSLATAPVASDRSVVVSATRNGVTRSAVVTVVPPPVTVASVAIAPSSLVGSNDAAGTVTLTDVAPASGLEVDLASSDVSLAAVPSSITVPPGATQASFTITTTLVNAPSVVTITATHGVTTKTATLDILPPPANYVSALTVQPLFIVGGTTATGTVTLAMESTDNGGSDVLLASSDPSAASVPPSVRVGRNRTSATFTVATTAIASPKAVTLTARYGGVVQRFGVIVAPENSVVLSSFTVTPPRVLGGHPATGTVTLSAPAPVGGASVTLESRRRNLVGVPPSVLIPAGATTATFVVTTDAIHGKNDRASELTATYNGVTLTTTLAVAPPSTASSSRSPVRCASTALIPCLTTTALATTYVTERVNLYTPELNLLATTADTTATAKPIAHEYIWFGGQPLAQIDNTTGAIDWYYNDHLGTPLLQTDGAGGVVWRVEHEPYGEVVTYRVGEGKAQPLRFPGQENDGSSALSYNIFRWYSAGWARYASSDPLIHQAFAYRLDRLAHHATSRVDPYSYASDSPVTRIDPLGLADCGPNPANADLPCAAKCVAMRDWARCSFRSYSGFIDNLDLIGAGLGILGGVCTRQVAVGVGGAVMLFVIGRIMGSAIPEFMDNRIDRSYTTCLDQCRALACGQRPFPGRPGGGSCG